MKAKKHKKRITELKAKMLDHIIKVYLTVDDEEARNLEITGDISTFIDLLITCNEPDEFVDLDADEAGE